MSSITIPLWLFLFSVGLPVISLAALIIGLIRAKVARRRNRVNQETYHAAPASSRYPFSSDVIKMILDQQIDAVFLSLSTIIETEKVKLKALVGGQSFMAAMVPGESSETLETSAVLHQHPSQAVPTVDVPPEDTPVADDLASIIGAKALKGMTPKEIARDMGLSLAEVVLALRMQNRSRDPKAIGGRLEAVA